MCVYLACASREPPWGDSHVVYDTARSLVDRGRLDIDTVGPPQFFVHNDGRRYGVFPLGNVAALAPAYASWKVARLLPGAPERLLEIFFTHVPSAILAAGTCALFLRLARRHGASPRAATGTALALGLCTILAVYARSPMSESLQSLALLWVFERILCLGDRLAPRAALWAGVAAGLLLNTKLVYALVLPIAPAYVLLCHRQRLREAARALAIAAAPFAVLVGVLLWHNHLKSGSALDSGYRIPVGIFSGDAYAALYGYWLSPGKSLLLYSPPLVLGLLALPAFLRAHRRVGLLLVALAGAVILVNARFRHWHGDYSWGPRLILPTVPLLLLPAAPWIEGALERGRRRLRRSATAALLAVGLGVQVLGGAFYWDHYIRILIATKDHTGAEGWFEEDLHHAHFVPQFSPLIGHAWMLSHHLAGHSAEAALRAAPWRRVTDRSFDMRSEWSRVRIDHFALDWLTKTGARGWGLALIALLVGTGAIAARRLVRLVRQAEAAPR